MQDSALFRVQRWRSETIDAYIITTWQQEYCTALPDISDFCILEDIPWWINGIIKPINQIAMDSIILVIMKPAIATLLQLLDKIRAISFLNADSVLIFTDQV